MFFSFKHILLLIEIDYELNASLDCLVMINAFIESQIQYGRYAKSSKLICRIPCCKEKTQRLQSKKIKIFKVAFVKGDNTEIEMLQVSKATLN